MHRLIGRLKTAEPAGEFKCVLIHMLGYGGNVAYLAFETFQPPLLTTGTPSTP